MVESAAMRVGQTGHTGYRNDQTVIFHKRSEKCVMRLITSRWVPYDPMLNTVIYLSIYALVRKTIAHGIMLKKYHSV